MTNLTLIIVTLMLIIFVFIGYVHAESTKERQIPMLTIAYEASGEPFEGQVAVARVIQNRAHERFITHDIVCLQKHQFSCWDTNGKPTQERKKLSRM